MKLADLQPNPFQPRAKVLEDENFAQLVESIKNHGVLEPLLIVQTPAGTHIIAGERRFRAAKKAGLTQVPVHLVKTTPKGMLEMAVVENIQRVNLTPLERAQACQRLINEFGYSLEQVAASLGKSRQYVGQSLQLLRLPDPIKDGLNQNLITEGHAKAILAAGTNKDMIDVYRTVIAENASVRRAEELVRFKKAQAALAHQKTGKPAKLPPIVDSKEYAQNWTASWGKRLHSQTTVTLADHRASTKLVITLKGDPQSRRHDLQSLLKLTGSRK